LLDHDLKIVQELIQDNKLVHQLENIKQNMKSEMNLFKNDYCIKIEIRE
jgi:hypothetical protein